MSHDELTLNTYDLPGGGHLDLVCRPAIDRVTTVYRDCARPDLDPEAAGQLGEDLLAWAVAHDFRPVRRVQLYRHDLPEEPVLAAMLERLVVGEDPTAANYDRYRSAYGQALHVVEWLPEALTLLEQLHAGDVVDAGHPGPSEVPFCAGRSSNPHDRLAMTHGPSGWRCPFCGETLEEDAGLATLADAIVADYGGPLEDDGAVLTLRTIYGQVAALLPEHRELVSSLRWHAAQETAAGPNLWAAGHGVPPTASVVDAGDLADVLSWALAEADGQPFTGTDRERGLAALRRLVRQAEDHPAPPDRDGDLVEDEDGAPLPESVQALIRTAEVVCSAATLGQAAAAIDLLQVRLETVLAEARR